MTGKNKGSRSTLLARRKWAIIICTALILVLAVTLVVVMNIVKTTVYTDVDETKYYIKQKSGTYAMYDKSGTKLSVDGEYGYYITNAGTLVSIDEDGKYETVAVVDTEGNEVVGINSRILMFPHIEKKNLRSVEVHNSNGTFTFHRYNLETGKVDDSSDFVIKSSPLTTYNQELFASLYVSAGYTITTRKINDPIKNANGEYSEYGLISETRTDDDGNEYVYTPSYYIVTDKSGNRYKVIIGDKLITGGGYYVQYVSMENDTEIKRDAVYVLSADIESSLLQPIESFVTPTVIYPMSLNNYFDVEKFTVCRKDGDDSYKKLVSFSYIDLSLRENTINASVPYKFETSALDGFEPSSNSIDTCLQSLYQLSFTGVKKLSPSDSDLLKYNLAVNKAADGETPDINLIPEYTLSFYFDIQDDSGNTVNTIYQLVFISKKNDSGNYYVYTLYSYVKDSSENINNDSLVLSYDMITEVEGYCFDFLTWDSYKWINSSYINLNIAFCDEITISSPSYNASFKLDNSATDQSSGIKTDNLTVHGTDSDGHDINTFSSLTVTDNNGITWTVTPTEVKAVNSTGTEQKISTAYYAYNILGGQVRVISGYISYGNGNKVEVTADKVTVTENGVVTEYIRYATNLFRQFYKTLLYASVEDVYVLSSDDENALVSNPDNWILTLTVKTTEGKTTTYSFYSLTSRKSYITVNGNGGFYVLPNRVNKFVSDAKRFFNNEIIDSTAKN